MSRRRRGHPIGFTVVQSPGPLLLSVTLNVSHNEVWHQYRWTWLGALVRALTGGRYPGPPRVLVVADARCSEEGCGQRATHGDAGYISVCWQHAGDLPRLLPVLALALGLAGCGTTAPYRGPRPALDQGRPQAIASVGGLPERTYRVGYRYAHCLGSPYMVDAEESGLVERVGSRLLSSTGEATSIVIESTASPDGTCIDHDDERVFARPTILVR